MNRLEGFRVSCLSHDLVLSIVCDIEALQSGDEICNYNHIIISLRNHQ